MPEAPADRPRGMDDVKSRNNASNHVSDIRSGLEVATIASGAKPLATIGRWPPGTANSHRLTGRAVWPVARYVQYRRASSGKRVKSVYPSAARRALEAQVSRVGIRGRIESGVRSAHLRVCRQVDANGVIKRGCRLSRGREACELPSVFRPPRERGHAATACSC